MRILGNVHSENDLANLSYAQKMQFRQEQIGRLESLYTDPTRSHAEKYDIGCMALHLKGQIIEQMEACQTELKQEQEGEEEKR